MLFSDLFKCSAHPSIPKSQLPKSQLPEISSSFRKGDLGMFRFKQWSPPIERMVSSAAARLSLHDLQLHYLQIICWYKLMVCCILLSVVFFFLLYSSFCCILLSVVFFFLESSIRFIFLSLSLSLSLSLIWLLFIERYIDLRYTVPRY